MKCIPKSVQRKSELVFPLALLFLFFPANYQNLWNIVDVKGKNPNKEFTHTHTNTYNTFHDRIRVFSIHYLTDSSRKNKTKTTQKR